MPSQGTHNNGNVAGYYYGTGLNSGADAGLSHTASYSYDAVNRLSGAGASPVGGAPSATAKVSPTMPGAT